MSIVRQTANGMNYAKSGRTAQKQSEAQPAAYSYNEEYRQNCQNGGSGSESVRGCPGDMNDYALAMAYVPMQAFGNLFDSGNALNNGTVFRDLVKVFRGGRCNNYDS